MSTRDLSVISPARREERPGEREYRVPEWLGRLTPVQGWDTYFLLLVTFGSVAWTVQDARWVRTPGLLVIVLASTLAGLALARVRTPWPLLHLAGLVLGSAFVVWQGSSLVDGDSLSDRVGEMWNRLDLFYDAATAGGISTDLLPVSLAVLAAAWLLGYLGSWYLFRRTNVWVGLVLSGLAMLTALSFLPDRYVLNFLAYIFLAMMLVARVTMIQRREQWRLAGVGTFSISRWLLVRATVVFCVVVLLVAAVFPVNVYRSTLAVKIWDLGRTPISFLEEDFSRLLSAIPSREDQMGRFFGTSLPFLGKIKFEGEVVFWTESEHPNYWLSRSYSRYTPQGWFAGHLRKRLVGPDSPAPPQESLKRELVAQSLQFSFDTNRLLSGGNMNWISREAVIETLSPMRFQIAMQKPERDAEFPEEVRRIAAELRETFGQPVTTFVESRITSMLPPDLVLVRVSYTRDGSDTYVRSINLARMRPTVSDVVSWRFTERLNANDTYEMNSFVSKATPDDLRTAGTNYSGFITDHYLQLPSALPQRVRDLASELTRDAETPLDKALAVRGYLRGDTFTYSQDIEKPPHDADGVDYFLFETREGYSDYFSSSMAVLLRAAGVPARLAAGYASGEPEEETERRAVKDSDSHGWTQVYFPGYGWIDFEPTPAWPESEQLGAGSGSSSSPLASGDLNPAPFECQPPDELQEVAGLFRQSGLRPDQVQLAGHQEGHVEGEPCDDFGEAFGGISFLFGDSMLEKVGASIGIGLAAIAAIALATWFAWTRGLGDGPGERDYAKMSRLGTLAGIGRRSNQTPIEYSITLGQAIPRIAAGAHALGWAFARGRYAGQRPREDGIEDLNNAWRSIRAWMLLRALRRLVPVGGA